MNVHLTGVHLIGVYLISVLTADDSEQPTLDRPTIQGRGGLDKRRWDELRRWIPSKGFPSPSGSKTETVIENTLNIFRSRDIQVSPSVTTIRHPVTPAPFVYSAAHGVRSKLRPIG